LAVAHTLAAQHALTAEIVTADAFQIYRGMNIGTAKPSIKERGGIAHHLIDIVDPAERFSVEQWLSAAEACIESIRGRGAVPIVVGGTHLYIKALMEGLFEGPPPDAVLRAELSALDPTVRRAELERVDPGAAARIHFNDERRTVRALEIFRQTRRPLSQWQSQWDAGTSRRDAVVVALEWPVEELNRRINARVKQMLASGLVEEVRGLVPILGPQSREAIGYKQLVVAFDGGVSIEAAVERIKIDSRRLGKSQRTWLRRLGTLPGALSVAGPKIGAAGGQHEAADEVIRALQVPPV